MKKNTDDLMKALTETENLQDYLEEFADDMADGSIAEYLDTLLSEKQMSKADVIRRAELSDSYVFQVFSGRKANPSCDQVISLAFGFWLTPEETQAMLKAFGLSYLHAKHKRDCIILYALLHGLTVPETNELLFDNNMLTLCEKVGNTCGDGHSFRAVIFLFRSDGIAVSIFCEHLLCTEIIQHRADVPTEFRTERMLQQNGGKCIHKVGNISTRIVGSIGTAGLLCTITRVNAVRTALLFSVQDSGEPEALAVTVQLLPLNTSVDASTLLPLQLASPSVMHCSKETVAGAGAAVSGSSVSVYTCAPVTAWAVVWAMVSVSVGGAVCAGNVFVMSGSVSTPF